MSLSMTLKPPLAIAASCRGLTCEHASAAGGPRQGGAPVLYRRALGPFQRFDPISCRRVRGEEAAAAAAFYLLQPYKRVDHRVLRVSGALQDLRAVLVRLVFLLAAVRARDQLPGDRRDGAASGNDLVE